jgi:hypothetical protein
MRTLGGAASALSLGTPLSRGAQSNLHSSLIGYWLSAIGYVQPDRSRDVPRALPRLDDNEGLLAVSI